MSDTSPRYWLLDWHGQILDHNPVRDTIVRHDLARDRYPGLWFTCEDPGVRPLECVLHKTVSLPAPLPRLRLEDAGEGLVALRVLDGEPGEDGQYPYAIALHLGPLAFHSRNLGDWERFAILDEASLHGILILAQPHLARITDGEGAPIAPLNLISETRCEIGDIRLKLPAIAPLLAEVAAMASGDERALAVPGGDGRTISVHRF